MDTNTKQQIDEEYKFKMSYVFTFFKDLISSSKDEETKIERKIKEIEEQQDTSYIVQLENDVNSSKMKKQIKQEHDKLSGKKRKTERRKSIEQDKNVINKDNVGHEER